MAPTSLLTIQSVRPQSGPMLGNSAVAVAGANFFPTLAASCLFGTQSVPANVSLAPGPLPTTAAALLAALEVRCRSPVAAAESSVSLGVALEGGQYRSVAATGAPAMTYRFYDSQAILQQVRPATR